METIIHRNAKKIARSLILTICALIFSSIMLYQMIVVSERIYVYSTGGFGIVAVACIIGVFTLTKKLLQKDKVGLILSKQGLIYYGASAVKKLGLIRWNDVESINVANHMKGRYVFLKMKTPNSLKGTFAERGIPIGNDELDINFSKMEGLIKKYWNENREEGVIK